MATIHVLDKAVAELIAAGEVVERPASIVKELLENAVDAGADAVSVEIQDGGVSYIRITDNGCGMRPEDLPKAFLRHATSKISGAEDLNAIGTLGFRGEALASIAAMSRVELISKTADSPEGASCRAEGGEIYPVAPAGCPDGTTVTVEDLFYNTPARMKFLKKNVSEGSAVAQVVDKCALSHPEIAFRFRRDGKTTLQTSGNGDLLAVIYAIYGKEFASHMIPVDYTADNGIRVKGYVSNPQGTKPSRTYQTFFINSRFVRTRTGTAAVEQAYKNKIMSGKFPACVLDILLDASTVDVNVHPAKIEVRFVDERPVFHAVYFAVKTALAKLETPVAAVGLDREIQVEESSPQPQLSMPATTFRALFTAEQPDTGSMDRQLSFASPTAGIRRQSPDIYVERSRAPSTNVVRSANSDKIIPPGEDRLTVTPLSTPYTAAPAKPAHPRGLRFVGELFSTYILLEGADSFVLVDKHAAHERILYEELKDNLSYGNRQVLLSSQTVSLSHDEYAALVENLTVLEEMGFSVEDFGGNTVVVRETPIELGQSDVEAVIVEVADKLKRGLADLTPHVLDRLYYSIACRSAVKAGDRNPRLALESIVSKLEENPQITHCPHGRPVCVTMTKYEVEKLFGRQG